MTPHPDSGRAPRFRRFRHRPGERSRLAVLSRGRGKPLAQDETTTGLLA